MVLTSGVYERIRGSLRESSAAGGRKFGFQAMGTWCQMLFAVASVAAGDFFVDEVVRWVADFETRYSRFLAGSIVSQINLAAGRNWVQIDPETERILDLCQEFHFQSRGCFDPTALPVVKLWDWKAKPARAPGDAEVRAAMNLVGWSKLERKPGAVFLPESGMGLDLGGIGKEYAVDRVVQLGQEHGIASLLVDFGQDLKAIGTPTDKPAWHIGLEDPKSPGKCWTGLGIRDRAVATSGDYLRHFTCDGRRYGHIIDPRTGYPVNNGCLAVSVVSPSCTLAGLVSTAAFILGPQEGMKLLEGFYGLAGCITTKSNQFQSRNFYAYVVS
jgi:FAD:protein FMN transferase